MRPTVRLISRRAPPAAPPLPRERKRSLGVVEIWLKLSHISTETPINLRGVLIKAIRHEIVAIILFLWYNSGINHQISNDNATFDSRLLIDF